MITVTTTCPRCGAQKERPRNRAHRRYCSDRCHELDNPPALKWYKQRYRPNHPRASASGCVGEHILIAETALGKFLPDGAEVHHVNRKRTDNQPSNLVICQDHAYHALLHVRARVFAAGGNPNTERICRTCKQVRPIAECSTRSGTRACSPCRREHYRKKAA